MSRRSLRNLGSPRAKSSASLASLGSPRKVASYSWEIEGSDYTRKIAFKALKAGEKLGFGLGGEGKRTEVVFVRDGTQSYWKGLQKGYKVITVNGNEVNDITVKSSIFDVTSGTKDFTIGFLVPNKPDWPDKQKDGVSALADDTGPPADDQPEEKKEDIPVVEKEKEITEDVDANKAEHEYESIMLFSDELKKTELETISEETLEKASKEELEELQRQKEEEYQKLKDHETRLKDLIKKKEAEFKEAVTRQNLEDLKALRKSRKEVADRAKRVLDDLERIRRMLALRLSQLAAGIKDLSAISAARDAKLRELEAAVKLMEEKLI